MWKSVAVFVLAVLVLPVAGFASPADRWRAEWPKTDFARHTVPLEEIISGGPPKDGIPAVDIPQFTRADEIDWLGEREPGEREPVSLADAVESVRELFAEELASKGIELVVDLRAQEIVHEAVVEAQRLVGMERGRQVQQAETVDGRSGLTFDALGAGVGGVFRLQMPIRPS